MRCHLYHAVPKAREVKQQEVRRMHEAEVFETTQSEFASPVVLVPKPNGVRRFCIDYWKINAIAVNDSCPLSRRDE